LVIGGLAVHEQDVQALERALDRCVAQPLKLGDVDDYELHATEMRNAKSEIAGRPPSPWSFIDRARRLAILESAYRAIDTFQPCSSDLPLALFGVVLDRRFHSEWTVFERVSVSGSPTRCC
jgi:hypothetical protein